MTKTLDIVMVRETGRVLVMEDNANARSFPMADWMMIPPSYRLFLITWEDHLKPFLSQYGYAGQYTVAVYEAGRTSAIVEYTV